MRVGVVNKETWDFLHEIYADLQQHHLTTLFDWRPIRLPVFNQRLNTLSFTRQMEHFLQTNDVVFFEWASEYLSAATQMKKRCGIVTRLHRYELYEKNLLSGINWEAVDQIILVSQAKKREFLEQFPELAPKVEIIYEAVNPRKFQINGEDPRKFQVSPKPFGGDIGILCHLTPRKRVYELVLVFSELVLAYPGFHLHIGGGPHDQHLDYYRAIVKLVESLNLQDKVTFYGHVAETAQWYQKIDIFISNSYSEGLQVAPLEAMASGCYCLSHCWEGAEEMLPEDNLYYTDQELVAKILRYCDASQPAREREREHLRSIIVDQFNIHRTKEQVRALIEAVGRSAGRQPQDL